MRWRRYGYEEDLAVERGEEYKKKKSIVLKASKSESNEEFEFEDKDMVMIARKFKEFFKKSNERRKFRNFKNQKERNKAIICFECKKPGHIKLECPLLKVKKKAMAVIWEHPRRIPHLQSMRNIPGL